MYSNTFEYCGKKYMRFKNDYWLLLFHHNHSICAAFDSFDEAKNVSLPGKYSILYLLNDEYRTKRHRSLKYEFIVNFPNLSYYYRWRQTNNPLEEVELLNVSKVAGYEPIHVTHNPASFGGLAIDKNKTDTLLNGRIGHVDWYVSIGMQKTTGNYWIYGGIPALYEYASVIDLWVRTPFYSFVSNCPIKQRISLNIAFIIFILIS